MLYYSPMKEIDNLLEERVVQNDVRRIVVKAGAFVLERVL